MHAVVDRPSLPTNIYAWMQYGHEIVSMCHNAIWLQAKAIVVHLQQYSPTDAGVRPSHDHTQAQTRLYIE
jgi:hypothetical protein